MRSVALALVAAACVPAGPPAADDAAAVRAELLHAWEGYRTYAWGHDELKPLSRAPADWNRQSLLVTPVDALDTLILTGLGAEADVARGLIDKRLSFDQDADVKTFEITIRLLGGLLSAHQLTGDPRLLQLADDLGARLLHAFDSPTGMPWQYVNLRTGAVRGPESNPAEIGTLILEFGTLSKLTGKPEYYDRAKHALEALWQRRSPIGLVGSSIDIRSGAWLDPGAHIGSGIDSYYEYLVKGALLFGDRDLDRMAKESLAAVDRHLRDGDWYGHADMASGKRTQTVFGALDAFFPAVLVLHGDLWRAERLENSAFQMWTQFGLEPELYDYRTRTIVSPEYYLRPEIIESAWYLWRKTHDPHWRELGRRFLHDLRAHCRTDAGYAAIGDVRTMAKVDRMESYFFAETLKYLYLLFAPDETVPKDAVFNTEAHPLRRTW